MFIIRILAIEGSAMGSTVLFEDQGEVAYLRQSSADLKTQLSHYENGKAILLHNNNEPPRLIKPRVLLAPVMASLSKRFDTQN